MFGRPVAGSGGSRDHGAAAPAFGRGQVFGEPCRGRRSATSGRWRLRGRDSEADDESRAVPAVLLSAQRDGPHRDGWDATGAMYGAGCRLPVGRRRCHRSDGGAVPAVPTLRKWLGMTDLVRDASRLLIRDSVPGPRNVALRPPPAMLPSRPRPCRWPRPPTCARWHRPPGRTTAERPRANGRGADAADGGPRGSGCSASAFGAAGTASHASLRPPRGCHVGALAGTDALVVLPPAGPVAWSAIIAQPEVAPALGALAR